MHPSKSFMATSLCSLSSSKAIDEDERLRIMALLALYDLLPHSISHPPDREEPLCIENAIDSESFIRCFSAVSNREDVKSAEDAIEEVKRLMSKCYQLSHCQQKQESEIEISTPVETCALKNTVKSNNRR